MVKRRCPLPAIRAARRTEVATIMLLGAGAAVDRVDSRGATSLYMVCQEGHVERWPPCCCGSGRGGG